jgi:hypothetical protein
MAMPDPAGPPPGGADGGPRLCHTQFSEETQVHTYMHAKIKFHTYSDIKVYTENSITKEKERLSEIYSLSWKRRHQT